MWGLDTAVPLIHGLLSAVSVTHGQPWSANIKGKIPEIIHKFKIARHSEQYDEILRVLLHRTPHWGLVYPHWCSPPISHLVAAI